MFDVSPEVVAVLIPIVFLLGGFAVVIIIAMINGKHKELVHKERMLALEKGIDIVEEKPVKVKKPRYMALRAWGLVFLLLGISFGVAMWVTIGFHGGIWGLLPASVGAALVVSANMERKENGLVQ